MPPSYSLTFLLNLIFQHRASSVEQKGRSCQGAWNRSLCFRRFGYYFIQGSDHIQPIYTARQHGPAASFTRRCKRQELDSWLYLSDRPLLVLVRLARLAGPSSEKVPGPPLCYLLYLLLWSHSVHDYSTYC